MAALSLILIFIACITISVQDFKSRFIHISGLLLLVGGIILARIGDYKTAMPLLLPNIVFFLLLFGLMYLYILIRKKDNRLINRYMGLGDVILFFILAFAYNTFNYALFIVTSCLVSIVWFLIATNSGKKIKRIPLAGFMATVHLVSVAFCLICSYDPVTQFYLKL